MTPNPWIPEDHIAAAITDDEREWVPAAMAGVWMRPLLFDTSRGAWVNVVRMRTEGFVSRHAHPSPVHGYVISGSWKYAERNWTAMPGDYLFEPAGDVHTLLALSGESQTLFWITGALIELDAAGQTIGYADVFTRIEQAASHFERCGLGRDHVKKYIR